MLSERLSEVFNSRALSSKALGLRYDEVYLCSSVGVRVYVTIERTFERSVIRVIFDTTYGTLSPK